MPCDGQNIRYLSLDNCRSQTTLIDAKPVFFGATIEENLKGAAKYKREGVSNS